MSTQVAQNQIFGKSNYLLKTIIGLAILVLCWILPPFAKLTPVGMKLLGLFIMVIYFCIVNIAAWPNIIAVFIMSFLLMDIYPNTVGNALYRAVELSWGYNIIIFVIASLFITYALTEAGFMNRIANWLMGLKFARKSPWRFTFTLLFVTLFIGLWFDPTATLLFSLAFSKVIFEKLGMKKGEKYPSMVVIGISFSVIIAFTMTPISHPLPILALGLYQKMTSIPINFVTYMALGIPVGVVCFAGLLAILRFTVKPDMKKLEDADLDAILDRKNEPMQGRELLTVIVSLLIFASWLLAGFLNVFAAGSVLAGLLTRITTLGSATVGVSLLAMIKVGGKPLMPFEQGMKNGVNWSIVVLLAALFMLGNSLAEPTTGFNASIVGFLAPFINSGLSRFVTMVILMVIISILTNMINSIPVVMLFLSVCLPLSANLGMTPLCLALLVTIAGELAFAVPSSFPTITMTYGDEWTQPKLIFRCGVIMMVWCMIVMAIVGYPLAKLMFS